MTKTFTAVGPYRCGNHCPLVIIPFGTNVDNVFGILNLGHWDLFEIWCLMLGIFMIKQATFVYSINYLVNNAVMRAIPVYPLG